MQVENYDEESHQGWSHSFFSSSTPSVEKGPGAWKQSCQGKAASEVGWAHTLLPTAAAKTGLESDITLPAEDLAVMGPGKQQSQ